jgi:DTW domain-containing protein
VTSSEPPRRLRCTVCLRAQSACICQWITPTKHCVELVVLQHPLEVDQAKGSARLLCLSLPHSQLVTGERFAPHDLQDLLMRPLPSPASGHMPKNLILLYPDTPDERALSLPAPPALPQEWLQEPAQIRLIVLDGTWRKSRKMLYLNSALQQLPRLALHDTPASNYRIRQAHRPGQLSTLEASCRALMQLERDETRFKPLLSAFDGFVAQQWSYQHAARGMAQATPPDLP